jgi:hypothetical protein
MKTKQYSVQCWNNSKIIYQNRRKKKNGYPNTIRHKSVYIMKTIKIITRVSEWLLFNANSAIFQLYHGKNMLIFNEMMIGSALY